MPSCRARCEGGPASLRVGAAPTGLVLEPIVTAETKLAVLREECAGLGIDAGQAVALGDGANDIEMIRAAGLGVAYQGKPVTSDAADLCIDDLNDLIPHLQPASH